MLRILILSKLLIQNKNFYKKIKLCVIQQQVPLLLPCVNFAQITTPSFTYQQNLF